jgi:hypothetical protein
LIDASEHFYSDDPKQGHPDVKTQLKDASYFFLGNGRILAAVQYAPEGEGTPLGLLIMDPEKPGPKRGSLTMDPQEGLEPTRVHIQYKGQDHTASERIVTGWEKTSLRSVVRVRWRTPVFLVRERFSCPDYNVPRLIREVRIKSRIQHKVQAVFKTGIPGRSVSWALSLNERMPETLFVIYELNKNGLQIKIQRDNPKIQPKKESPENPMPARILFHHPLMDLFYSAARNQLTAVIAKSGKVDAGIWQYNREWVRDNAMIARGLLQAGQPLRARIVLERLLQDFVRPDGATIDSSRVRDSSEAELDQNGILLHTARQYYAWSGDIEWIKSHWETIRALADYPLKNEFRHRPSGLLANHREFWERHRFHGIQRGIELAYQVFVSLGLEAASELAALLGDEPSSRRWKEESSRLKHSILEDSRFGLVHNGSLIKRRGIRGAVQDNIHMQKHKDIPSSVPLMEPGKHALNPDSSAALPIALSFISPQSPLAQRTLDDLEQLWNQGWTGGGYGRYNMSSEPDSPGPWPFASLFIARANMEAGNEQAAWKVMRWLHSLPGSLAGTWFEFYGRRPSPPFPQVGIPPWTWSEMLQFIVHHMLGIRPGIESLVIQPRLLPGIREIQASFPLRKKRLTLNIVHSGEKTKIISNTRFEMQERGRTVFAYGEEDIRIKINLPERW